ncbi:GntP family permease [Brachybacterium sp. YJGR34]|uniref:GntP family permease n=1 Tax=Brachybacterium sp. YJGR34 TaxID=2059911 RepID=UPI000E0AD966|nr:GntP family permease [Brachybacterium sp. YJGR34]
MEWVEETGWTSWLGDGGLMGLAVAAVLLLLFLVIRFKLHAFLALILVSALTALAAGVPAQYVVPTLVESFGGTLGGVALLVALGAMLGSLVESSGGARALAEAMVRLFGEKRAPFALGVTSLVIGFPIFMDAAFVLMIPIVYAVARRLSGNVIAFGFPVAAALSIMHVYVPPHPGPVAAAEFVQADVGVVMILGLLLAFPTWFVSGHLWGKHVARKYDLPVPDLFGTADEAKTVQNPPAPWQVVFVLVLPLLLILLNTGLNTLASSGVLDAEAGWVHALRMVGETPFALLITALVTVVMFGFRRGRSGTAIEATMEKALGPVCSVILITGAGGMFGGVLRATGIGDAIENSLAAAGIPIIFAAYLIAMAMRLAQGSATVALTTAAALISPAVLASDAGSLELACIVMATAAGSVFAGHVNDSGFWLVGRLLGMDVKTTLKTWTVQQAIESVVAFVIVLGIYGLIQLF